MCFLLQFSFRILLPLAGEPQDISVPAARMLRIVDFKKSRKVKSNLNSDKLLTGFLSFWGMLQLWNFWKRPKTDPRTVGPSGLVLGLATKISGP